ncbi:glycosyltransferase [Alkalimarinus sediminis]|uniref:Glycosyltransferase n=1 Tax=Alkalimarinus sediminis TaxID=1632866 RepID=A0A9E8HUV1_9ALTE|nr:glycosyltransferase [Alkalimarinus sediminis]
MLVELALEQIKAGHSVTICSIGTPSELEKPIEKVCKERGINVYPLRMKAGLNLLGGMNIVNYAKQHGFDLFHSHGYKGNILLGLLPIKLRRLPLIMTLHGKTTVSGFSKMRVYEILDQVFFKRMDAVVVVANELLERRGLVGRKLKNLTVIPNGISEVLPEIPLNDPIATRLISIKKTGPIIGSIGRLSEEKGYSLLILAFAKLKEENSGLQLVIMGDGPLKSQLINIANKAGVSSSVCFMGYIDNASHYLTYFDIYVNSSFTEGMPITLLEAMRADCPIVASKAGGMPELLKGGEYGNLFSVGDIDALSLSLKNAFTGGGQKVTKAKKFFKSKLTSRVMSDKYIEVYNKVISNAD